MPRLKSTTGNMQHDDAVSAPIIPPMANNVWLLPIGAVSTRPADGKGLAPRGAPSAWWLMQLLSFLFSAGILPIVTIGARYLTMRPITDPRVETVAIGELSRRTGIKPETIRYYEKVNMLPPPRRTAGGRRVYGPAEARILGFIRRARELGFTPDEVRTLLALGGPGKASCADVSVVARRHLDNVRAKIADLKKLERLLGKTIGKCSGRKVPDCPVIDILDVRRGSGPD